MFQCGFLVIIINYWPTVKTQIYGPCPWLVLLAYTRSLLVNWWSGLDGGPKWVSSSTQSWVFVFIYFTCGFLIIGLPLKFINLLLNWISLQTYGLPFHWLEVEYFVLTSSLNLLDLATTKLDLITFVNLCRPKKVGAGTMKIKKLKLIKKI